MGPSRGTGAELSGRSEGRRPAVGERRPRAGRRSGAPRGLALLAIVSLLVLATSCTGATSDRTSGGDASATAGPSSPAPSAPSDAGSTGGGSDGLTPDGQPQLNTNPDLASGNTAGQVDVQGTHDYIVAIVQDADGVWTRWFLANNLPEPRVGYQVVMPGGSYTSTCQINGQTTFTTDYPNAFYCDLDRNDLGDAGMLVLPDTTFAKMWNGDVFGKTTTVTGDFAAGAIVAHEFGHHVQAELAIDLGVAAPANPGKELIADCFSGVYTYGLYLEGGLEDGDVDEALDALDAIGDTGVTPDHGTGAQRKDAFLIGLNGSQENPQPGVPYNCIKAYWPAALAG